MITNTIHRWLAQSGVHLASEKRQRLVAKEVVGDNLEAEMAPFCYSQPCSEDVIRVAAYAYAPNLIQKVTELLDENERYRWESI